MEKRYILEVVEGSPPEGRFFLSDGELVIGRHSKSDICIGAEARIVSKRHALLVVRNETVIVRDCGSVNYTYVNGQKIDEAPLQAGDILWLGEKGPKLRLVFESSEPELKAAKTSVLFNNSNRPHVKERDSAESIPDSRSIERPESLSLSGFENIGLPLMSGTTGKSGDDGQNINIVLTTKEVGRMVMGGKGNAPSGKNISKSQEILLSKAAKAYRKNQRVTYGIVGAVIVGLLCLAVYYALGYYRYERMMAKGIALKNETKQFDRQYETLRQTDTAFSESSRSVLQLLHDRERQLDSIMALLPLRYQQRFFSDSTERYLCDVMIEFNEPYYRVPPHMLELVKKYINKFSREQKKQFELIIGRKDNYFPYIEQRLRAQQVPVVLAYMAMQESGLNPHARSDKDAVGLWQFMKKTALDYGLQIGPNLDERENWQKSTDAAARYLHNLLAEFGEGRGVFLAIAAYNTGEGKIREALRKNVNPLTDRDFWHLYRTSKILVEETREYVPQILAQIIIDRHRSVYGIQAQSETSNGR
jgi:pSer/pThr/pTyr-binding forkhead associated (FHA) protein